MLPLLIFSEINLDSSLSGVLTTAIEDEEVYPSTYALGNLTIKSSGNRNVKSLISLDMVGSQYGATMDIAKAWVKFRYPLFRGTIGKTRVSWGDGIAFNSGDVVFYDLKEELDLTGDEVRSQNRLLTLLTIPLGRFTLVEGIYIPWEIDPLEMNDELLVGANHIYGGRIRSKLLGTKVETGYVYRGLDKGHHPYLSLSGTLGVDYHLSGSAVILDKEFDDWKESINFSGGIFYLFELENERSLSARLEALYEPYKDSSLTIYPEVTFTLNEEITFLGRSVVNPIDEKFKVTAGCIARTYQGLKTGLYTTYEDEKLEVTINVTHSF